MVILIFFSRSFLQKQRLLFLFPVAVAVLQNFFKDTLIK